MLPEYHLPLYLDLSYTGDISGGGAAAGRAIDTSEVVEGRNQLQERVWKGGRADGEADAGGGHRYGNGR